MDTYKHLHNVFVNEDKLFISDKDTPEKMYIMEDGKIKGKVKDYLKHGISISATYGARFENKFIPGAVESLVKKYEVENDKYKNDKNEDKVIALFFLDYSDTKDFLVKSALEFNEITRQDIDTNDVKEDLLKDKASDNEFTINKRENLKLKRNIKK